MSDDLVKKLKINNNPNNADPRSLLCQYGIERLKAADEITLLRARLDQAERERAEANSKAIEWHDMWSKASTQGFRAGIEAAAHLIECDGDTLGDKRGAAKAIRALVAHAGGE